jgi:hypothetical protein
MRPEARFNSTLSVGGRTCRPSSRAYAATVAEARAKSGTFELMGWIVDCEAVAMC